MLYVMSLIFRLSFNIGDSRFRKKEVQRNTSAFCHIFGKKHIVHIKGQIHVGKNEKKITWGFHIQKCDKF